MTQTAIEFYNNCLKAGISPQIQSVVARIVDQSAPQPAQRFKPADFGKWIKRQLGLAQKV